MGISVGVALLMLFALMFESIVPIDKIQTPIPLQIRQPKITIVTIPENASFPGNNFEPSILKVIIGINNTVNWVNRDAIESSVVADDKSDPDFYNVANADCKLVNGTDEGCVTENKENFLMPGKSFQYTFTKAGVFGYHSVPHPQMKGTVIVEEPMSTDASARVAKNKE